MNKKYSSEELLKLLLEAIDYSFLKTDGTYDKSLTYPVIDKVNFIKTHMNSETLIRKAAEYLYMNLPSDMSEEDKQWWVNDFVEYMTTE